MSYETRTEYIMAQKRRYKRAGKPYKTRFLDEVNMRHERKHAIKLLNGSLKPSRGKRGCKTWNAPGKLFCLSAHSTEQARPVLKISPDYIGVGSVFPSPTKANVNLALGTKETGRIMQSTPLMLSPSAESMPTTCRI